MRLPKGILSVTAHIKFTLLPETLKHEKQHIAKCYVNCILWQTSQHILQHTLNMVYS